LLAQFAFGSRWRHDAKLFGDLSHVVHVRVAVSLVEWSLTESLVCVEEAVHFGHVNPSQKMRIVGGIRPTIGRNAADEGMHVTDAVDRALRLDGRSERGDGEEICRALQAAPRVVAIVGVLCDTGHGEWVQGLDEQCPEPTDEHRRVGVHQADRSILGKPSLAWRFDDLQHTFVGIRSRHPFAQCVAEGLAHGTQALGDDFCDINHETIVPASGVECRTDPMGSVGSMSDQPMPKWIYRAVAVFWLGFLAALVVRNLFGRVSGFMLLLLVALFLALAIEPGVNWLQRRGWKRGTGTGLILFGVLIAGGVFVGAIGSLVASQTADVLSNSETYVNDTVDFINGTFGTNIDPAEVNAEITDPDGAVQQFIKRQQSRVFSLSVNVLTALLQLFSVLLFTFYMVADGPRLRRVICSRLAPDRQRAVLNTWNLAIDKTGGYLYSRALLAVISSFIHWVAFQSIGIPAPIAMAVWVGIVSQFIPVLGTYLAGILPVLLTFLESPLQAVIVIAFIVVYQQVENYLVAPRITARTLQVHAAVAFGSAILGAAILGPIGAILALPASAMIQSLVGSWGERHDVIDDELVREAIKKPRRIRKLR
jgi:predicted PurR-regulated permease PerM